MLLIIFNLNAQIDVVKYDIEELVDLSKCGTLSDKDDRLISSKGLYYLKLKTSNRFDNSLYVSMGSLDEAMATFKDIQDKWYTMNSGDYFMVGDVRFGVYEPNKKEKVLMIKDLESAGMGILYLKSIQACYLVLRNISINMSHMDTTKVENNIIPNGIQVSSDNRTSTTDVEDKVKSEDNGKGNYSIADELLKLNQLKEMGVLTEEEFKTLKSRIISK